MADTRFSIAHTPRAWDAAQAHVLFNRGKWPFHLGAALVLFLLMLAVFAVLDNGFDALGPMASVLFGGRAGWGTYAFIALLALVAIFAHWIGALVYAFALRFSPLIGRESRTELGPDGIVIAAGDISSFLEWSSLDRIAADRRVIAARLWTRQLLILPRRAFASDADYDAVLAFMRERVEAAKGGHASPSASSGPGQ